MNIKATFPAGVTEITVNGLHQWDYGRQLEVHAPGLPALVEIHFACAGMDEAVVRACEVVNGVATATIPDICLEQTSPVCAWVYVVDDSTGFTVLTVTLPVIARTKPQPGASIPAEMTDKYTEALTAMNALIARLQSGDITANRARLLEHWDYPGDVGLANKVQLEEPGVYLVKLMDDEQGGRGYAVVIAVDNFSGSYYSAVTHTGAYVGFNEEQELYVYSPGNNTSIVEVQQLISYL